VKTGQGAFHPSSVFIFVPPQIFHHYENHAADREIEQQSSVFFKQAMPRHDGQMRHEQAINRIAGENGHESVEEALHVPNPASAPAGNSC
jgi:hypothetical protein